MQAPRLAVVLFMSLLASGVAPVVAAQTQSQISVGWLDQEIPIWQKSQAYPIMFSAQFTSASYDNIDHFNVAALDANLNMLYQSGAGVIRMDIGYDAWLSSNQSRIGVVTDLVRNITSSGRMLVIADAAAETYRNYPASWSTFQSDWIQRVRTLAALYQPTYYIVIKEPGWYTPLVSDANTNPQFQNASVWVALTQQLADAVHQVSPKTMVGVSVAASDMTDYKQFYDSFLTGIEASPQVSFIGFDIYNIPGFTNTQSFLTDYGSGDKAVWIAEAWSGSASVAYDSTRSELDTLWMQGIYDYAMTIHAGLISPFFTDIFASYQSPPTDSQSAIGYFAGRTPVFDTYLSLSQANQQLNSSASSSSGTTSSGSTSGASTSSSSSTGVSTSPSSGATSASTNKTTPSQNSTSAAGSTSSSPATSSSSKAGKSQGGGGLGVDSWVAPAMTVAGLVTLLAYVISGVYRSRPRYRPTASEPSVQ